MQPLTPQIATLERSPFGQVSVIRRARDDLVVPCHRAIRSDGGPGGCQGGRP